MNFSIFTPVKPEIFRNIFVLFVECLDKLYCVIRYSLHMCVFVEYHIYVRLLWHINIVKI